jgi:hypothetical protein
MTKSAIAIAALLTFAASTAANATGQTVSNLQVTHVATGWGGEGVYFSTAPTAPTGCENRFVIPTGAAQKDDMLAILLMSLNSGSKVSVYLPGGCYAGVHKVDAVGLSR